MSNLFFNLAWLIIFFPALAFALIVLVTRDNKELSSSLAVGGIFLSWLVSMGVFFSALSVRGHLAEEPFYRYYVWSPAGNSDIEVGWMIDPLSAAGVAFVTTVCLMIFIYSQGYMTFPSHEDPEEHPEAAAANLDPRYSRFFAYISLFATGMLGFVLSSNLVESLVFWEIMGLCSYLLIGFWYNKRYADPTKITPAQAGLKAFMTTRVGDMMFFVGIIALYAFANTVNFREIFEPATVKMLTTTTLNFSPLALTVPVATVIAILLFGGAVGKSAQFPLHVWLPDAMEGPTPVSALIHAATMVAAGVFLVARMLPIFNAVEQGPAMNIVTVIGALTALFAATMAVAQFDIKRVLAYSTISQLGYMIMALGIGAFVAGIFHLITHAFFKALLFLGSGSVIHGVEHGMYHEEGESHAPRSVGGSDPHDANDMRNMGGLSRRMRWTFLTFLAGTLALTGIPPFAGFFSKDEILAHAFEEGIGHGNSIATFAWILGTAAAFLTAFYMARQIFMVFSGDPSTDAAEHAPESPFVMTGPLMVLAFFSVVLGFVGLPENISPYGNPFHSFIGERFAAGEFNPIVAAISVIVAAAGWVLGWFLYGLKPAAARERDPLRRLGPAWTLLNRKYFVDEVYHVTVVRATIVFSTLNGLIDQYLVDGAVNGVGWLTNQFSVLNGLFDTYVVDGVVNGIGFITDEGARGLRLIQTGRVQNYLLVVFFSVLVLVGLFFGL
ncbi:MAG: NADH-quinone oxidoreductase subunit L [Anaerolineae bacterium]